MARKGKNRKNRHGGVANRACIGYPNDGANSVGTNVICCGCRRPIGVPFYARLRTGNLPAIEYASAQDADGHFTREYQNLTSGVQYTFEVSFDSNFLTIADSVTFTA
jgi:hypothetical protein